MSDWVVVDDVRGGEGRGVVWVFEVQVEVERGRV